MLAKVVFALFCKHNVPRRIWNNGCPKGVLLCVMKLTLRIQQNHSPVCALIMAGCRRRHGRADALCRKTRRSGRRQGRCRNRRRVCPDCPGAQRGHHGRRGASCVQPARRNESNIQTHASMHLPIYPRDFHTRTVRMCACVQNEPY